MTQQTITEPNEERERMCLYVSMRDMHMYVCERDVSYNRLNNTNPHHRAHISLLLWADSTHD